MPRNLWGFLLVVPLLLLACDGGEEEARPEPTSSSMAPTTVTTASEVATCLPEESPEPTSEDSSIVLVYFICEERHSGLSRRVPPGEDGLRTALEELVKGPNERERKAGFRSPFDGFESDRLLVEVVLKDGHAVIDFSRALADQNVGGGTAFTGFLFGSLDPTVFQFPTVQKVTYRLEGDAHALCLEFQIVCEPETRAEWEQRQDA